MMFKKIYHFLGSFYFAIIIIALMAIIVTAGTFTESYTNSHLYAALYTYNNPIFNIILVALFINILVSAMRRWPFKLSHTPFLITHLGLLMLISGVIIKNIWGVQGNMSLTEGGASHTITIPNTQVIHVEKRDPNLATNILSEEFPITSHFWSKRRSIGTSINQKFTDFSLELAEYFPHCEEQWDTWIKGTACYISGLEPFPVYQLQDEDTFIPISTKVRIFRDSDEVWDLYAVETDTPQHALNLIMKDTQINEEDLFNEKNSTNIYTTPKILFLKNEDRSVTVHAIDRYGHLFTKDYQSTEISPLVVYNEGFGGYFATLTIPFPAYPYDGTTIQQAKVHQVTKRLRKQNVETSELSPPLQLLDRACRKTGCDFAYCLAQVQQGTNPIDLSHTLEQVEWPLLPAETVTVCYWAAFIDRQIKKFKKEDIPESILKLGNSNSLLVELQQIVHELPPYDHAAQYSHEIALGMFHASLEFYGIDLNFLCPNLSHEETQQCLVEFIQDNVRESRLSEAFPPLKSLSFQQKISVLKQLSKNREEIAQMLPTKDIEDALPTFSRSEDLWNGLEKKLNQHDITIETPITPHYSALPPTKKLEDNRPKITLLAKSEKTKQFTSLAYDSTGQRIRWPILRGDYRLSFQPKTLQLPLTIRLHDARQINYPNTGQPLSYEADIIPSDKDGEMITISMNNVYESNHGYRFYLSNITPGDESSVQHVQLVVNYDPAKYLLTYPGGVLIAIGTLLLFWFRPKYHGTK
ncbi:MAG: hypothetical protein AAGG81_07815 [Chlamydiota bacterium]